MSLDQLARARAAAVREKYDTIIVPEPDTIVRRARHRRALHAAVSIAAVVIIAAAALTPAAFRAASDHEPERIRVNSTRQASSWARVSKDEAGLGGSTINFLSSDGASVLAAGERPEGTQKVVTLWWSPDGLHWNVAASPQQSLGVTALAAHGGTAIAIGAPGGPDQYVLRSTDGGRTWTQIAIGNVFGVRPGPSIGPGVSNLTWQRGWWIASGSSSDAKQSIWVSRDGSAWRDVSLEGASTGVVSGVVASGDGSLMAWGAQSGGSGSDAWFTRSPSAWGNRVAITGPGGPVLIRSVAEGARLAVGFDGSTDQGGSALQSSDGGRTWSGAHAFQARFPDAGVEVAAHVDGTDVFVGIASSNFDPASSAVAPCVQPAAWRSSDGRTWRSLPKAIATGSDRCLHGGLDLVTAIGSRIVMMSSDPNLGSYYTLEPGAPRSRR